MSAAAPPDGLSDSVSLRDAVALTIAQLRGDREGIVTILDNCDQRRVASHLMGMAAGTLTTLAGSRDEAAAVLEGRLQELRRAGGDHGQAD